MRNGESCWPAYQRKRAGESFNATMVDRYNSWYGDVVKNYSKAR